MHVPEALTRRLCRGLPHLLIPLALLACGPARELVRIQPAGFGPGTARLEIELAQGYEPRSLVLWRDGRPVPRALMNETPPVREGWLGDPTRVSVELEVSSGIHVLAAAARFGEDGIAIAARALRAPRGQPDLAASSPSAGSQAVPRDAWIQLEFASALEASAFDAMDLRCGGSAVPFSLQVVASNFAIVDPSVPLPGRADCTLQWRAAAGPGRLVFSTARAGTFEPVPYDRWEGGPIAPFPDDYLTVEDPESETGIVLDIRLPEREPDVMELFGALVGELGGNDGFSPVAPMVVHLRARLDTVSIPLTPAESLHPGASVALVDLDPSSPHYARRIPFRSELESAPHGGPASHTLLVWPSFPLRPGGRYGLVVTRRVRTQSQTPLGPSPFLAAALAPASPGERGEITRTRQILAPLLEVFENDALPAIAREDVALALRFSVRSTSGFVEDLVSIRAQVTGAPPARFSVEEVVADGDPASHVAAIVHGTWEAPDWREGDNLARDENGHPVPVRLRSVPFTLALPDAARDGPVPVVLYQHGSPGDAAREVPAEARRVLAGAGFAVIGFTDVANRELGRGLADRETAFATQLLGILSRLIVNGRVPDLWVQTNAEQIAFVRMIRDMGALDLLPVGSPDGVPDLDAAAPLGYVGISQGASHAPGLLAYAPEIRAAALVAGGARLAELFIQERPRALLESLAVFFPNVSHADVWLGLSLLQSGLDVQDAHNHARFIYNDPLDIAEGERRASVLLIAGIGDSLVPNFATDSLAWQLGPIPLLEPSLGTPPFLETAAAPVFANVDPLTTAAYVRYVPAGLADAEPTEGCEPGALSDEHAYEGHFCAQLARESLRARARFLRSALGESAPVIDAGRNRSG